MRKAMRYNPPVPRPSVANLDTRYKVMTPKSGPTRATSMHHPSKFNIRYAADLL